MTKPWKIFNLDLSDGIPALSLEPEYDGLFVIFWWQNIPLGDRELPADLLPLSPPQVLNLALAVIAPAVGDQLFSHGFRADLPRLPDSAQDQPAELAALMAIETPMAKLQAVLSPQTDLAHRTESTVSVVICTRDRPNDLERCLRSLQQLSPPPHEILVVDNAPSTEQTQQIVAQMQLESPAAARTPPVRYILEPRPGLSVARNTGIRHSTGDMIAFTDDDVVVHQDWLSGLQRGFRTPDVMAVTGLMLPAELETEAQRIFQRGDGGPGWGYRSLTFNSLFFEAMQWQGVPVWCIGAGANMAFRREVFAQVGYFDERLGAGASGCSEDSELWYRILAEGGLCIYEPTAVIYHYHRKELDSLKHQAYHYMRGHVMALFLQFERYSHWGNLRRAFITLPWLYFKLFLIGLRRGFHDDYATIPQQIRGCMAGVKYYLDNRSKAPFIKS